MNLDCHIGLRYSHVGTPRYSGYWKGSEAFRYHPEGKDLFSLPFGIGYIYESKSPEHTTSFYADLAYVPVFGGRSADMRVQACGIVIMLIAISIVMILWPI